MALAWPLPEKMPFNEVMTLLGAQIEAQGGPDPFDDELLTAELRDKAEMAKRTLSNMAFMRGSHLAQY